MPDKKPQDTEQSDVPSELEKRVDAMMSVEKEPRTDVSKIAADINKKLISGKPVKGNIEVKPSAPPELPDHLRVAEEASETKDEEPNADTVDEIPENPGTDDLKPADEFDDKATNDAVDDIVAEEGDIVLDVEDDKIEESKQQVTADKSWKDKLKAIFSNKWTWVGILLVIIALMAVPMTRYKLLGMIIKRPVTVTVVDSKTGSPVSSAQVNLGSNTVKTDENGKAELNAGLGQRKLNVTKKYYTDLNADYFVGFKSSGRSVKLVATGRLVPVKVINRITGKPLASVVVESQGTSSRTNSKGQAEVALPVKASAYKGSLKLKGYEQSPVTIQVTDKAVKENTFGLVPAGHVYFLSNLNGTIDVVKSKLDGSGRKTVLEGSGHEDASSTSLLASRDWRYLVLKSRRDSGQPALYLIDTATDKVTSFDTTDADFTLIGWYDHSFVYSLTKNTGQYWQAGKQAIKSYDADHLQLNQLDQTQAEGNQSGYAYQSFLNFYILNGTVSYNTQWYAYNYDIGAKNDTVRMIQPNGQGKKDLQNFPAATTSYIEAALYQPQNVYYAVHDSGAGKISYYELNGSAIKQSSITQSEMERGYPTYLLSPSGNKTFWAELRDGKNSLFIGGPNGDGRKQIAALSNYSPYGWFGDSYGLVSKNSSELYIMSPSAPTEPPLKITDYYKPAQTYQGYGYGYGGL